VRLALKPRARQWHDQIRWIWRQDDHVRDVKQLEAAWLRIFGTALPPRYAGTVYDAADACWRMVTSPAWDALWADVYDAGDREYRITYDGRVWYYGCDGGAVGLISGPYALVP
jgi:hypothetical protein